MNNFTYGVILNNMFYSNRMEFKIRGFDNGIYSMDMDEDDFRETVSPANIDDARKFFSKASKVVLVKGTSFHDGLIPENPVKYPKIPIKVEDATYDEMEEVEVICVKGKYYFLQILYSEKSYALMDLKEILESDNKKKDISHIKGVTPDMRVVFAFHLFEKKKKELEEPVAAITALMVESGATVFKIKKTNRGYEVLWGHGKDKIDTLLDKNFRVIEAGFCVSNWDKTQSATSIVKVLKDYQEDGSYVNKTRV